MKKILFFIPTLSGGGAEKVLVNLVNNLDCNKYDVTVQTLFDYGVNRKSLNSNIKYKFVFKRIFRGNIYILKLFSPKFLFKKMIKEKYNIIVSYLEGPTTRIVAGCNDKNTKLISWVHTGRKNLKSFLPSYRNIKELEKTYRKYDYTVFVSYNAKEYFCKNIELPKDKALVIRNVIDVQDILNKAKIEKAKNNEIPVICTIGRLVEVKGYMRLLKIHKKLIDEGMKNKLWILGEGEEENNLKKYIEKNSLSNSVQLLGYKTNPYKYLNQADIYVCSSYAEGYNTAVVEAIILGKPVITTKCAGMDEILDNGKYGMIVENDDEELYKGIKKMLQDKKIFNKYKELANERREYYNINEQMKEVEKLLEL